MAKPNLALIPAAQGTKFYSVLPSDGIGDFDFTRASAATRVNKNGLIETVASGQSRLNYPLIDGVVNGCPSHLLEPSRQNVLQYSQDFTNAYWINNGVTVDADQAISPDGTLNADLLTGVLGGFGVVRFSTWSATNNVASCFAKKASSSTFRIANASLGYAGVTFDLENGVITSASTGFEGEIENYGNGWYRCVAKDRDGRSGTFSIGVNGASQSIYMWGSQLEQTYKTSYILTTNSSATRVAETANGAGDASTFNDSEGVLFVETKGFIDIPPASVYIQLSKNGELSGTNSLIIQHRNNGYLRIYVNGFGTSDIHFNENIDFTQNHKIAVLYKLNGYKLFIDGVAQSLYLTPTQTVFSGLDNLSFDLRGSNNWNGSIKDLRVYNTVLTDSELQALTTL